MAKSKSLPDLTFPLSLFFFYVLLKYRFSYYCSGFLASILGNVMEYLVVVGSDVCMFFVSVRVYVLRNCTCKDDNE